MTTPHKHSAILHAIADGKRVQVRHIANQEWIETPDWLVLHRLSTQHNYEFRIAPDTIKIGKRDVERPSETEVTDHYINMGTSASRYAKDYFFTTKENAEAFYDALVEVAGGSDETPS